MEAEVWAPGVLLPIPASVSNEATFWSSSPFCLSCLSMLSMRDYIAFCLFLHCFFPVYPRLSEHSYSNFLIGRSSSSFALMNAIASLRSAMSTVAVVDVTRVCSVGTVWKFAIADVLRNLGRHGWVVR